MNRNEDSDYKNTATEFAGSIIGWQTAIGIADTNIGEVYCIEHGEEIGDYLKEEDYPDGSPLSYIYENTGDRCMYQLPNKCYLILIGGKHPDEDCSYEVPSKLDKILDFILRRKRATYHPVSCSKPIGDVLEEQDD